MSGHPGARTTRHPGAYKVRFYHLLGQRIRKQRHEAGLTLKQLAEACQVSVATLDKWEDGEVSVPSFSLHLIEIACGCNLYDLVPVMSDDEESAA